MTQTVDVDKIWRELGVWRPYQLFQLFYIYICTFPLTYPILSWVFIGYTPPFQCKPLEGNLSEYNIGINGNASSFRIQYEKCDMTIYSTNSSPDPYKGMSPKKYSCPDGYQFDHNEGETLTMEWNLLCGKSGLGEMSITMVMIGMCVGAAIFSSLADRYGRKPVAVVTHITMLASTLASAFMPNLAAFAAINFITGTMQQGLGLSTAILNLELFPTEWRGTLGLTGSLMWTICVCSLPFFGYLMRDFSWRYLQIVLSLVSFHAVFGPLILDESLRWLIANKETTKVIRIIQKAARWNRKDPNVVLKLLDTDDDEMIQLNEAGSKLETEEAKAYIPSSCKDTQASVSDSSEEPGNSAEKYTFIDLLRNRVLRRNSVIIWYTWLVNSGTYYGLYLTSGSMSVGDRYLSFFINGLIEIPAALLFYVVIDRIGRKYTSMLFHGIAGFSLILSMVLLSVSKQDGDAAATASMVFNYAGKFGISSSFLTIFIYIPELYPTNLRNVGIGFASAIGRIGGMMAPYSILLMQYAVWAPGVLFGSCCLLAMLLMFFLPETGGYILPQTIEEMERWTEEQSYCIPCKRSSDPAMKKNTIRR